MESTLESSERFSKALPSVASASLGLRVVRRRTVGFAVERLDARVGLFFGAGIQETYQVKQTSPDETCLVPASHRKSSRPASRNILFR